LERRFRAATWNAIRNIAEKGRNRRKWFTAVDPVAMAGQYAGRAPYNNNIVEEFRSLVGRKLGKLALAILDTRLEGGETKSLVGIPSLSIYKIKQLVQQVKSLSRQFAERTGNWGFARMVARAMDSEQATVTKRKATAAARQAQ
jgi:hypothetical protein